MAELVHISDAADPRLADYVGLTDGQLRKSLESEQGLFIAEGAKVIRRAVETGHPARSLMMTEKWLPSLADLLATLDCPVYLVSDAVAESLTGFAVHRGALASMSRLPLPTLPTSLTPTTTPAPHRILILEDLTNHTNVDVPEQPTSEPKRILILEDLTNHTNVGAIFRCAAALGVDLIVLSPRCADPLYRRSVKVSMGAVFAVPYVRMTDWHNDLSVIRGAGFRLLALTPDQDAVPFDKAEMGEKVALMLGSEGDGLSSHWIKEADEAVTIPMSASAMALGVDSLNVVAATAIACHSLVTR
ncbi:tRNA G18 (ribose-2'-O)-methylase SpoU [Actinocorallia herbida]|uniref:tRNA G18 (Ribose-2'-O)-methylase SpoU n=1 Tax=Actinocorallia herbida TaxID=58109 RepID=A0A3N1D7W0_9ACTN|nr:RNA methyltransferase [Actinocorallia herbida]ROO89586.1 tRNA G18 (ribose-2'-O)-methylase SpoU [Actinocorallia herbida]